MKKSKINRRITEFAKVINTPEEPKICEFIRDINNETVTETIFRTIRGHVEVVGKLTKKDSLWILEAVVADGTGIIEVSFSNKVLNYNLFKIKNLLKNSICFKLTTIFMILGSRKFNRFQCPRILIKKEVKEKPRN